MTRVINAAGEEVQLDTVSLFEILDPEHQAEIAWQRDAACRKVLMGTPQRRVHAFFPDRGKPADRAKEVCATCPVWEACLEYSLKHHLRDGVWGGRTEKERRVILRARRLGMPIDIAPPLAPRPRITECCHGRGCDCAEWKRRLESPAA